MYEFEDRGGRRAGPAARGHRPHGAGLGPAPSAAAVEGLVRHARPSATSAPQAGRYRQHHQLGVEALGTGRPRSRRRGGRPGRRVLPLPRARHASRLPAQLDGRRRLPARRTSTLLTRAIWRPAPTSCAPSTGRAARGQPAAGARLQARRRAGPSPPTPRAWPTTCATPAACTSTGCGRASTPWACPTSSTTAWSAASTTTPGPPSSSPRTPWSRPRTASAAAAATTGWSRCWAVRPPRASGSASASSGSCWPATPKACFPVAPAPLDAFVVDVTGGTAARDLTAALRRAGLPADRAFDDRSMKSQLKAADRSGALVALIVGSRRGRRRVRCHSGPCGAPVDQRTVPVATWSTPCVPPPAVPGPPIPPVTRRHDLPARDGAADERTQRDRSPEPSP